MREFEFSYTTALEFDRHVSGHSFALRCIPFEDGRQRLRTFELEIVPDVWKNFHTDSFGNRYVTGFYDTTHNGFSFAVRGIAQVDGERHAEDVCFAFYRFDSPLTRAGSAIFTFAEKLVLRGETPLMRAMEISNRIFKVMRYEKFRTNVNTTAEEALAGGAGVCQDYTHIFLAVCRLKGIACRYCAGLAACDGETHSWAEIYDGAFWYGIDPTNNCLADESYLKLSHGRDFRDCAIDRGIFLGAASQTQKVASSLTELEQ